MKKVNQKGFALVETLIVSVFVVTIFTIIFTNFYPLIGEYEKVENYDDVDGKYAAYWMKIIFEDNFSESDVKNLTENTPFYYKFNCEINDITKKQLCNNLKEKLSITDIYITKYNLSSLKDIIKNNGISDIDMKPGIKKYIKFLPNYKKSSTNDKYRIIIKMNRKSMDNEDSNETDPFIDYSTMEVDLK